MVEILRMSLYTCKEKIIFMKVIKVFLGFLECPR